MDIATIDYWANSGDSCLHRSSALSKGVAALAFVTAVVVASSPFLLLAIYLLLAAGVFATRLHARRLFALAAYPTIFTLLFVASRWSGGLAMPVLILLKTLTAAQVMVLLIATTPYPDLFAAIGRITPNLLGDGLFVTYRSFFILAREMDRKMTALRLRGGIRPRRLRSNLLNLSRALGMLLVRAVDLSEKLYAVLKVRGYRGRLVAGSRWRAVSGDDLAPLAGGGIALGLALLASLSPELWASSNGLVLMGSAMVVAVSVAVQKAHEGRKTRGRGDGEKSPDSSILRPGNGVARTQDSGLRTQDETTRNSKLRARNQETMNKAQDSSLSPYQPSPRSFPNGRGSESSAQRSADEVARVSCVRHVYPDGTKVSLCGLDFVAHRGERVVLLGPNGAGKSTLLNHLLGLLRPTEGEVVVLGHDPAREFAAIQPRLGVLLQNVDEQLLGPTVADDVAFGALNAGYGEEESRAMARRAMDRLGVLPLADKVPHYLSGGEKRKVALAGALVTDPELLVLDEPFEGLDPRSRAELVALLEELHLERDLTIIVTTHHVDLLPVLADTVYLLADGGHIIASGTPDEIFSRPDLLQESSIEPPALTLLFQRLLDAGVDLGSPVNVDDAAQRLLSLVGEKARS